jgi:hypothetical protein
MKLRFHTNALRLRLSRPEVDQLAAAGRVEDAVTFAPGRTLRYAIESGPATAVQAMLEDHLIVVQVPAGIAQRWIESDQTGIEGGNGTLKVLIEKDFQCLHAATEEDRDAFPNPLAGSR